MAPTHEVAKNVMRECGEWNKEEERTRLATESPCQTCVGLVLHVLARVKQKVAAINTQKAHDDEQDGANDQT